MGSGKCLKNSINKHGIEHFKKDILEEFDNESLLNEREIYWIDKLDATDINIGYNISRGGIGGTGHKGCKHSKESRDKMSKKLKGRTAWNKGKKLPPMSDEQKEKRRIKAQGKKHYHNPLTLEQKCLIPGTQPIGWILGMNPKSVEKRRQTVLQEKTYKGNKHPMYGKKHTEQSKKKMSLSSRKMATGK
jgi:group I intron endonuclease